MEEKLKKLVLSLKDNKHTDKETINKFLKRFSKKNTGLSKEESYSDHICAFFVPVNKEKSLVYLGHHIKANDWIPPGGHIQKGELPIETVVREFEEELRYCLKKEEIRFFDISVRDLEPNPRHNCKRHYDFWFAVFIDEINFDYLEKEYYDAGWHTFRQADERIKTRQYNNIVQKIKKLL